MVSQSCAATAAGYDAWIAALSAAYCDAWIVMASSSNAQCVGHGQRIAARHRLRAAAERAGAEQDARGVVLRRAAAEVQKCTVDRATRRECERHRAARRLAARARAL